MITSVIQFIVLQAPLTYLIPVDTLMSLMKLTLIDLKF